MKKEGDLGLAIGLNFEDICQQLDEHNDDSKQLILEFTEGLRFLIRQALPLTILMLYLAEYKKKINSEINAPPPETLSTPHSTSPASDTHSADGMLGRSQERRAQDTE